MKASLLSQYREKAIAFDTETHKIQPGLLAPPLVCASVAMWSPSAGKVVGKVLDKDGAREWFVRILEGDHIIIGANIAYDMLVMATDAAARGVDLMPLIVRAYEEGRVYDVQIAEALHAVALGLLGKDPSTGNPLRDPVTNKLGRYSLSIVLWLLFARRDAKINDRFRQSYALLEDTPIAEWPPEAQTYPVDDAVNTWECGAAQVGILPRVAEHDYDERGDNYVCRFCNGVLGFGGEAPCPPRAFASFNLHDLSRQCYAAVAMHFGAAWGFAVDPEAITALEARVRASRDAGIPPLVELGFLRWKTAKGVTRASKHTAVIKRSVALSYGCAGACPVCAGTQKVPSAKTGKPVGCRMCDSTGLDLDSASVPRTKGSKCRTCKSSGCAQCAGQPPIVPGCGTGRDALYESGEEKLIEFAAWSEEAKLLEVYIPYLMKGTAPEDTDEDTEEGTDE